MTGSDKVKMVVDGEPEEETMMTSSSSWSRPVSWLHLCIIYGLLGIYGLWAATSYQLIRTSLLDELGISRRMSSVVEELCPGGSECQRLVDMEAPAGRRRSSADDDPPVQSPAVLTDVGEIASLSRRTRETRERRTGNNRPTRRRYAVYRRRPSQPDNQDATRRPRQGTNTRRHRRK